MNVNYKNKYLKYKNKYLKYKQKLIGGSSQLNIISLYNPAVNTDKTYVSVNTTTSGVLIYSYDSNQTKIKAVADASKLGMTFSEYDINCGNINFCCSTFNVHALAYKNIPLSYDLVTCMKSKFSNNNIINQLYNKQHEIIYKLKYNEYYNEQKNVYRVIYENMYGYNSSYYQKSESPNQERNRFIRLFESRFNNLLKSTNFTLDNIKINMENVNTEYIQYLKDVIQDKFKNYCGPNLNNDNAYVFFLINLPYNS